MRIAILESFVKMLPAAILFCLITPCSRPKKFPFIKFYLSDLLLKFLGNSVALPTLNYEQSKLKYSR